MTETYDTTFINLSQSQSDLTQIKSDMTLCIRFVLKHMKCLLQNLTGIRSAPKFGHYDRCVCRYAIWPKADLPPIYNEMYGVRVRYNYHPLLEGAGRSASKFGHNDRCVCCYPIWPKADLPLNSVIMTDVSAAIYVTCKYFILFKLNMLAF